MKNQTEPNVGKSGGSNNTAGSKRGPNARPKPSGKGVKGQVPFSVPVQVGLTSLNDVAIKFFKKEYLHEKEIIAIYRSDGTKEEKFFFTPVSVDGLRLGKPIETDLNGYLRFLSQRTASIQNSSSDEAFGNLLEKIHNRLGYDVSKVEPPIISTKKNLLVLKGFLSPTENLILSESQNNFRGLNPTLIKEKLTEDAKDWGDRVEKFNSLLKDGGVPFPTFDSLKEDRKTLLESLRFKKLTNPDVKITNRALPSGEVSVTPDSNPIINTGVDDQGGKAPTLKANRPPEVKGNGKNPSAKKGSRLPSLPTWKTDDAKKAVTEEEAKPQGV